MSNLRQDHLALYLRVRLKAIVHIWIGLVFILFPPDKTSGALNNVQQGIGDALKFIGGAYLAVGLLLAVGLYLSRRNYVFARTAIVIAVAVNVVWCVSIMAAFAQNSTRGLAYVLGLSAYLTYNCFLISRDPGWEGIALVKEYKEATEDERATPAVK